jgi:intracellular sulfur oxidation DsrE/DsrF family protein
MMKSVAAAIVLSAGIAGHALAEGKVHHVAFHVNENDPQVMNIALNNVANLRQYYVEKGDDLVAEVVTYGPGLQMLTADSPVKDRIAAMALEDEHLSFSACNNTIQGIRKKTGKDVVLLSEAKVVPSGVVRLTELQEEGYAYVKP